LAEQVWPSLQPLPYRRQIALAVANRDHETGGGEDRELADVDHLFRVDVARRLDHHVDRLPVGLQLRALMSPDGVLDRQLVQPELLGDRLEFSLTRLEDANPNEGAFSLLRGSPRPVQREIALSPLAVHISRTVDDHRCSIAPGAAGDTWHGRRLVSTNFVDCS
jgi:hypothetical protein